MARSPRDRLITLFGRLPVLEALEDDRLVVDKVVVADTARGDHVDAIVALARSRGVALRRRPAAEVTRLSRNGRQDQGVVADVVARGLGELDDWLSQQSGPAQLLVIAGLTTPANVGMVIRSVAAAGLSGVVVPRRGSPDVGPMVVKASAGTVFRTTILRHPTPAGASRLLSSAGFCVLGLRARDADLLYDVDCPDRAAWVLGSESAGVGDDVPVDRWIRLPLAPGVESLNAAVAAGVVAYELVRRGRGAASVPSPEDGR